MNLAMQLAKTLQFNAIYKAPQVNVARKTLYFNTVARKTQKNTVGMTQDTTVNTVRGAGLRDHDRDAVHGAVRDTAGQSVGDAVQSVRDHVHSSCDGTQLNKTISYGVFQHHKDKKADIETSGSQQQQGSATQQ